MKTLRLLLLVFTVVYVVGCSADQRTEVPPRDNAQIPPVVSIPVPLTTNAPVSTTQPAMDTTSRVTTKITITIGQQVLNATLYDNPTTRDFLTMLPLTLTLTDYANFEKISVLSKPLTTNGVPAGSTPSAGDIAFYAPWGNLALFHRDFSYSTGLVMMGKFDSDVTILRTPGAVSARIERAN